MSTQMPSVQPAKWLGLPVIATIARLLCRELTLQNEYLRLENKILKSKIKGRIRFTDDERRSLVDAALAMGRKLMESVVNIVKPATILAWQQRLEKEKWDYSKKRERRPRAMQLLADLGTPPHTLRALMGHSNIQTTMKFYIKNNDENSMKAVRGLEGLMGE